MFDLLAAQDVIRAIEAHGDAAPLYKALQVERLACTQVEARDGRGDF